MNILLAVDGSPYTKRMLGYIAAHDEFVGAANEFTAITVVPAIPPHVQRYISREDLEGHYADEARKVLEPIEAFAKQHGWKFKSQHLVGNAGEVIAETATKGDFDLLVMGSHGHSTLGSLLLGSVASRALAQCKTPILLVR